MFSEVIGKGGNGLRLIREASNCHLEVGRLLVGRSSALSWRNHGLVGHICFSSRNCLVAKAALGKVGHHSAPFTRPWK